MLKRRVITIAALLILSGGLAAQAQESGAAAAKTIAVEDQPSKEQLDKLFAVMRLEKQLDALMKSMTTMMQQQVAQQIKAVNSQMPDGNTLTPGQQEALEAVTRKYMDKAIGMFPVSEMLNDMAELYQHHLSRQDVDALIAFYSSRAGQDLLDAQPAIMQEYMPKVMARSQERSTALLGEMMRDLKSAIEEIKKQPDDLKKN